MLAPIKNLLAELRTMPRALWVLTGGQFINRFGSFVFPFMALYLQDQGLSLARVSWVLGAIATGGMLAPFLGGYLADAIGRRNTIVASLVGAAVTVLALLYSPGIEALLVSAFLHGLLTYMFHPASQALMTDVVPPEKRVLGFAIFRLALNAGFATGPAVAGLLYGISPALIFWGDAATTLVFAVLALLLLPHGLRTVKGQVSSPRVAWRSWKEAAIDSWLNRPFLQLMAAKLLMAVAFIQVFNVLVLDTTARGLSKVEFGWVMGFNGFLIMLFELPLANWIKRLPAKRMSGWGFAGMGLGCASFALAEDMTGFFLAMSLFTFGEMIALPISAAYASELAPAAYRGRYFGFISLMWGTAAMAGSAGVWCYGQIGSHWWWVTGLCGVLAGVIMTFTVRDRRPPVVEAVVEAEA
jgi:MFS family permease